MHNCLKVSFPPSLCRLNMAAVNRPPSAHPGPNGGNLHTRPNSGIPNSGPQDPGLHGTSQDPGLSSYPQHHVSARPIFYVPAPPPPPFFHYQWPMPFSYNPFAGFPGMGESYGFFFSIKFEIFFLFLFCLFRL